MSEPVENEYVLEALEEARRRTGAYKQRINITTKEWEAIQAGAVSNTTLTKILNNTDLDKVKELATPRTELKITSTKALRIKSMLRSGYTQAEISDHLGVSTSVISDLI